ncbi:MAG: hypothetical protein C0469_08025 [Cyanobacteria bacterium DS2.3.42]|nr:hypothetical protein [Cyanobacteria bacterium DS2.3.42]
MPMRTDRGQVAMALSIYAIAGVCLFNIHPVNPWLVAARVGLLTLLSGVCVYAVGLLFHGFCSKRVVCVQSFSPLTNNIIQCVFSLICSILVAYPLYTALAVTADHRSMNGWRSFANFQTKFVELMEGRAAAERFWNKCLDHLASQAISFERNHDYKRALDYYTEYQEFADESTFVHFDSQGVLGRVYDELKDFKEADAHYDYSGPNIDEYSNTKALVCRGKLIRVFEFVPEKVLTAEFPWAEHLAEDRKNSALQLGQCYEEIDFSELDDYQRQLLRPVFHPEMLVTKGGEGYAPELETNFRQWKRTSATPVAGHLLPALTYSHAPTVEEH